MLFRGEIRPIHPVSGRWALSVHGRRCIENIDRSHWESLKDHEATSIDLILATRNVSRLVYLQHVHPERFSNGGVREL